MNTQSASFFSNDEEKSLPQQLRLYMTHPACGTTKMFRVERSLENVMQKGYRSVCYETFCEKCGTLVRAEIAWCFLSPTEQEREAQLELVAEETLRFLTEAGKQALSGTDMEEVIARAKKKWQGGEWRV